MTIKSGRRQAVEISHDVLRVRPLAVAVIPIEDPSLTPSGLYIPDEAKQRSDNGVIKHVGSKVEDLSIGDHVLFPAYVGTKLAIKDVGELIILPASEVIAVLPEKQTMLFTREQALDIVARLEQKAITSQLNFPDADVLLGWLRSAIESFDGESFEF